MAGKFVITKNKKGQYHFNLMASNGKVIASSESYPDKQRSESYPDKQSAMKGIASIVKNAPEAKIVDDTGEQAAAKKATKAKAAAGKDEAVPKPKTPRARKPAAEK